MLQSVFIMLREGLEASLIVGILLAYLSKTGNRSRFGSVWIGTGLAIGASLIAAALLFVLVGELVGTAEQIYEGTALLTAVAVLTYMIFWMRRQAVNLKGELQARVDSALRGGSTLALVLVTFIIVVREGIESVLFMFASVQSSNPLSASLGGVLGLAAAVLLGYSIYTGASRLNLQQFFNVTGVLLILFAGGMLALGVGEWQEAGLIPFGVSPAWDVNSVIDENGPVGQVLKTLFGFQSQPSVLGAFAHVGYLIVVLALYFKPGSRAKSTARPLPQAGRNQPNTIA
ncbi:MAG: iron uptake transporter permease EfeU [Dehalococcoidia bacterium]|nr:iron uptake transporter permease EfeU [Dehalococcoidia bacterium]